MIRWMIHPALVTAGLLLCHALGGHAPHFVVVTVPIVLGAVLILVLERKLPYREDWQSLPGSFPQDLSHNLLSTIGTSAIARALSFAALAHAAIALKQLAGGSLWPHQWPMAAQLALGLVVKELPYYITHRLLHATQFGWRLHTLHHSSERLYAMASGRTHPVNVFLTYGIPQIPLVLVGATDEVFALISVFMGLHGLLQHSNVDLRYGWLNFIFATADIHRRHHSRDVAESSSNFGHNLVVWDHLFGSFVRPDPSRRLEVGVAGGPQPKTFWQQLAAPFRKRVEEGGLCPPESFAGGAGPFEGPGSLEREPAAQGVDGERSELAHLQAQRASPACE